MENQIEVKFLIFDVNPGFCQITYRAKINGELYFYCLQDQGPKHGGIRLMKTTKELEPEYEIQKFKEGIQPIFERAQIFELTDSEYTIELKTLCNEFLKKRGWV